jgi:hypothetical protein
MKTKNRIAALSIMLSASIFAVGCGVLNKDSKALTIDQTIAAKSKLVITLQDNSGFNLDIENQSADTLFLERKGLDNLMITRASVKAIIEPEASASLVNPSDRAAKVRVRVSNHNAEVRHRVEQISADTTATK